MKIIFGLLSVLILFSCSKKFVRGGYFHSKQLKNFYANDKNKLYIQFSENYFYNEKNFNTIKLKPEDEKLLKENEIKKARKILFSYHSFGRDVIALQQSNSASKKNLYKKIESENGDYFWYRFIQKDSAIMIDNLYPLENKYIRIIEKTKTNPKLQNQNTNEIQKAYISPRITRIKPF